MRGRLRHAFLLAACAAAAGCAITACSSSSGPAASPPPAARLANDTGVGWDVDTDPNLGTPDLVAAQSQPAPIVVGGISAEEASYRFFEAYRDLFGMTDPRSELSPILHDVDVDGAVHVGFDQVSDGVRVEGAGYNLHFTPNGSLGFLNGKYVPGLGAASHAPTIDAGAATASAEKARAATDPSWTPASLAAPPSTELVFLSAPDAPHVLAWRVLLDDSGFDVDASNGAVLRTFGLTQSAAAAGSGIGFKGDKRTFQVTQNGNQYAMQTPSENGGVPIAMWDFVKEGTQTSIVSNTPDVWDLAPPTRDAVGNGDGLAVDAYWRMRLVLDWYEKELGWRSYDGAGSQVDLVIHLQDDKGKSVENAFWYGTTRKIYLGDGNAKDLDGKGTNYAYGDLDTLAHELTHGVTQFNSQLEGCGLQNAWSCPLPAGLNESFSDIFASLAQSKLESNGNPQTYAEFARTDGKPNRDMLHPKNDGECDGTCPGFACLRPGAVTDPHLSAGISNNAYALMTWGGTNDESNVKVLDGIKIEVAERLWWLTQHDLIFHKGHSTQNDIARAQLAAIRTYSWFPSFLSRWFPAAGVAIKPVACAWVATGVVAQKLVKDRYQVTCYCEKPNPPANVCGGDAVIPDDQLPCCKSGQTDDPCCKSCVDAGAPGPGPNDAGGGDSGGGKKTIYRAFDSCDGRADGTYCSVQTPYSAFVCKNNSVAYGLQCSNMHTCLGPNGPGSLQCEGDPPSDGGGGGGPDGGPSGDTCAGRADGVYCSVNPSLSFYGYQCTGGTTSGSQYCPSGKKCVGPNGPGTMIVCQ